MPQTPVLTTMCDNSPPTYKTPLVPHPGLCKALSRSPKRGRGRRELKLGPVDRKACTVSTLPCCLPSTQTRESINSYSLIPSRIPSPLSPSPATATGSLCSTPPPTISGKGREDRKDTALHTPAVPLPGPRIPPPHWQVDKRGGNTGGLGPGGPLLAVTCAQGIAQTGAS